MAETPTPELRFEGSCPDCGVREPELPAPLPEVGDDFDWNVRDYDGFRLFMLEELIARFPDRTRWTPADMEVVLVETLAVVLDQLSDTIDRVSAEQFLETARRPSSVLRLLGLIGYDAAREERLDDDLPEAENPRTAREKLELLWTREPSRMDAARLAGPRSVHTQRRMVTLADCENRLEEHPLVKRAHAWSEWTGSWTTLYIAVIAWNNLTLEDVVPYEPDNQEDALLRREIKDFHQHRGLRVPDWAHTPTVRTILRIYVDAYRMAGQEMLLRDAEPVGIAMALSVRVTDNYFQSEVRWAVRRALGQDTGGLFEPGRLRFGEDVHASDVIQAVTALAGVDTVCLNRFKRMGREHPDQSDTGRIMLDDLEIAVCDNDPARPERGHFTLQLHGGRKG
jgi:hypothetical protein